MVNMALLGFDLQKTKALSYIKALDAQSIPPNR